jgi:hypothetical protein
MLKLPLRLFTRACRLKNTIVALDITEEDFHFEPLKHYVTDWFIDVDDFINYLTTKTDGSVLLIVSNLLADIAIYVLCPFLPQISKVYILGRYLRDIGTDRHADQRFPDVDSLLNTLVYKIVSNVITHQCYSSERSANDLTTNLAKHIWYQFFFDLLSHLSHTDIARKEMLKTVRAFHQEDIKDRVLLNCKEFEENYKPKDIIRWYTRTSFFYAALNRALRSENINHMFAYRYVVSDLERSLHELQTQQSSSKYEFLWRGQQMYMDELNSIESNVGNLIGTTTFWSVTPSLKKSYYTAIAPMRDAMSLKPVVFIIDTSLCLHRSTFVDISHLSPYRRTQEILFLPHSLFRIAGVSKCDTIWYINLILVDETDEQFIRNVRFWETSIGLRNFFSAPISGKKQTFFDDISKADAAFLRFQLLIDMILRLDHTDYAKDEMLELCREKFASNSAELTKIDVFEKTYMAKNAITWYTKDCFLHRLLNEALRSESIDLIVKLRYFIHDLHNQLAELHSDLLRSLLPSQRILKLYRGLRMTMAELEKFRQNETNFVSTNSFLSTTRDHQAALFFAGEGKVEDPEISVIYEIFVDTTIAHSVPFAEIEYKSIYMDEDEVLFSMAAVFRIGKTEKKADRLWQIELTLTPPTEEHWNILTAHLKK